MTKPGERNHIFSMSGWILLSSWVLVLLTAAAVAAAAVAAHPAEVGIHSYNEVSFRPEDERKVEGVYFCSESRAARVRPARVEF